MPNPFAHIAVKSNSTPPPTRKKPQINVGGGPRKGLKIHVGRPQASLREPGTALQTAEHLASNPATRPIFNPTQQNLDAALA